MGNAILVDRGAHCKVYALSAVSCAKTTEPIHLPYRLWTRVDQRMHKFNRIHHAGGANVPLWKNTLPSPVE